jgi:DnaJ-class molecular chaperone
VFTIGTGPGEIIQPDSVEIFKGKGMPILGEHGSFGDLHITWRVTFPKKLTQK